MSSKSAIVDICMPLLDNLEIPNRFDLQGTVSDTNTNETNVTDITEMIETEVIKGQLGGFIDKFCKDLPIKLILEKSDSEHLNLIKHTYPVILIFGIFANMFSFILMTRIAKKRKNFQKFSFSLAVLSITDLGILIFGCSREYLDIVLNFNIRSSSVYSCKLIYFLCYVFSSFSAYLNAYIACERWNAISNPIKNFKWTLAWSRSIIATILIVCIAFNMPLFWFANLREHIVTNDRSAIGISVEIQCEISENDAFKFLIFIDTIFYCLIPFTVTTLFSAFTLYTLLKKRGDILDGSKCRSSNSKYNSLIMNSVIYKRQNLETSFSFRSRNNMTKLPIRRTSSLDSSKKRIANLSLTKDNKSDALAPTTSFVSEKQSPCKPIRKSRFDTIRSSRTHSQARSSSLKITIMLIAIPINYLITSLPIFVVLIYNWIMRILHKENVENSYYLNTAYTIGTILMYFGCSINIFFYIMLGKSFRLGFKSNFSKFISTVRKKDSVKNIIN